MGTNVNGDSCKHIEVVAVPVDSVATDSASTTRSFENSVLPNNSVQLEELKDQKKSLLEQLKSLEQEIPEEIRELKELSVALNKQAEEDGAPNGFKRFLWDLKHPVENWSLFKKSLERGFKLSKEAVEYSMKVTYIKEQLAEINKQLKELEE